MDDAALWLLQNATPLTLEDESGDESTVAVTTIPVQSRDAENSYRCVEVRLNQLSFM